MAFKDIREFIAALKDSGELIEVNQEVDWNLEIGAIMRRANERGSSAQIYNKIKGYPPGYRITNGLFSTFKRLAMVLGLPDEATHEDILDAYDERIAHPRCL
jgi:4-hydroxy-3-polyprenylbenzoate decarboxylase